MKFEKHLKRTGINAVIYKATNGNLFLRNGVFGNVLVRIPEGCAPISTTVTRGLDLWMNQLVINGSFAIGAQLAGAMLDADGTPQDIKRVYRDVLINGEYGNRKCIISQDAYTLIERYDDIRILYPTGECPDEGVELQIPALVILDKNHSQRVKFLLSNITKREEVNHMAALAVIMLGGALIATLMSAHHSWTEIQKDSDDEK